ncbi:MAG: hypothetical protein R8G60_08535 [Roseovarius pacificus]|nr:hypothetical protein [Roseovarius pacificus]
MKILDPDILLFATVVIGLILLAVPASRNFLESKSGAVGVILALIAGAFVLKEHELLQQDARLDRTRSYIERIESGATHLSRQWLDLHWIRNRELITAIDEANAREDGREESLKLLAEYRKSFDETDMQFQSNIQHVMRLFYFYSDLAKCVELGLCDAPTACNIFADDIGRFYVLHASFIKKWRRVSFEKNFDTIKVFMNVTCKAG